jgi:hypothetical protein
MYYIVVDPWTSPAAIMAISVAVYVPVDQSGSTNGTITTRTSPWYLSTFTFTYMLTLYGVLIPFLVFKRSTNFPFRTLPRHHTSPLPPVLRPKVVWSSRLYRKVLSWLRELYPIPVRPSGLHHSPATIAGLAAVFQDMSTRQLCDGIDAMQRERALEIHRTALGSTSLLLKLRGNRGLG